MVTAPPIAPGRDSAASCPVRPPIGTVMARGPGAVHRRRDDLERVVPRRHAVHLVGPVAGGDRRERGPTADGGEDHLDAAETGAGSR